MSETKSLSEALREGMRKSLSDAGTLRTWIIRQRQANMDFLESAAAKQVPEAAFRAQGRIEILSQLLLLLPVSTPTQENTAS